MSATIMMPTQFDEAIRSVCADAVNHAVAALATKYGFDAEEALRDLNPGELKLVRKRGPSPKKDTEKSVAKKAKSKKEGGETKTKTKRGKTGYLLYADEIRADVRAELEAELAEGVKLKPQAVVSEIAIRWNALDEGDRKTRSEIAKAAATPEGSDEE
jgi:hypothetical protein